MPLIRELATRGQKLKVRTICLVSEDAAEPPEAALRIVAPTPDAAVLERTGPTGYRVGPMVLDELGAAAAETLARELAPAATGGARREHRPRRRDPPDRPAR